ncbi:hypothetical protein GCM10009535_32220 [Streptomyces thermocarboxydovorans]|uniref:Histidine kinase/HSP90-like ATPase domain-containing protein n=1 Tax=Streptomyces thermocarboxydovorans TaxID=59298 RepID=A0ABP3SM90_9ACTN
MNQEIAELAANAATHGRVPGRSFRLTLYVAGAVLRIEVSDTRGDRLPVLREPGGGAESGRGLLLVDALADRWGVSDGRFPRRPSGRRWILSHRNPAPRVPVPSATERQRTWGREPFQAPPLPPMAALTRAGEHPRTRWIYQPSRPDARRNAPPQPQT